MPFQDEDSVGVGSVHFPDRPKAQSLIKRESREPTRQYFSPLPSHLEPPDSEHSLAAGLVHCKGLPKPPSLIKPKSREPIYFASFPLTWEPPEHFGSVHYKESPKPPSPISTESREPTLKYQFKFSIPSDWKPPSQKVKNPRLNRTADMRCDLLLESLKEKYKDLFGKVRPPMLSGGIGPGDPLDPKTEYFARFAVTQFNKENNAKLKLVRVLGVRIQFVSGVLYFITLQAKDESSGKVNECEAKVWDIPWMRHTSLEHFWLKGSGCSHDGNLLWLNEQASTITFK